MTDKTRGETVNCGVEGKGVKGEVKEKNKLKTHNLKHWATNSWRNCVCG